MVDTFTNMSNQTNPADRHFLVAPHDTTNMTILPRTIYCAVAGTAQVVDAAGTVLPYVMTAGQYLPFRGVRINATSTTGTYYGWY